MTQDILTTSQILYNNISANDLRFLLGYVDEFNKETADFSDWLKEIDHKPFLENLSTFSWAHLYEQSFADCLRDFFLDSQLTGELSKISASENKIHATLDFQENLGQNLDKVSDSLPKEQQLDYATMAMCYGIAMMKNAYSLMAYGHYINELVAIARSATDLKDRDEALFKAIHIDTSVITCPTAQTRVSKAVLLNDAEFFKDLKNAVNGKLGTYENKIYQKMKFILQVLHESGGINLSDDELKELFVEQLNLYSDSQRTAAKNLGEFTRNFKKKKSTI